MATCLQTLAWYIVCVHACMCVCVCVWMLSVILCLCFLYYSFKMYTFAVLKWIYSTYQDYVLCTWCIVLVKFPGLKCSSCIWWFCIMHVFENTIFVTTLCPIKHYWALNTYSVFIIDMTNTVNMHIFTNVLLYVTLSVKTQLKLFFVICCYLQKIILHVIKKIIWNFNLYIFNIDWVR